MRKISFFFFLLPFLATAQSKEITLEDIYKKGTFVGERIPAVFDKPEKTLK